MSQFEDPQFLRGEAIRQARLATGAMAEADRLRAGRTEMLTILNDILIEMNRGAYTQGSKQRVEDVLRREGALVGVK